MTTVPAAPLRRQRLRTALALATAAGALAAAAFFTPRPHRPTPLVHPPSTGSSALSAALVSSHVLTGTSETYLAVSLTAPSTAASVRSPASVAIVFDRSTSMKDEPIAQAKAAAIALVDRLGPDDEIALISYSTHATVDLPLIAADERGRARAKAAIASLEALGATNISEGLSLGADELIRAHTPLRRVVLISDGTANEGIYQRSGLVELAARRAAKGVSITAVGVGLEFNEQTMTGISAAGRGSYYFVEDTAKLSEMFVAELDSLGQTAITDGSLRITPAPGVQIIDVLGYPSELAADGTWIVPIADLRQNQRTKVILRVVTSFARPDDVELATVQWSFRELGGSGRTLTATARATVTPDERAVQAGRDRDTVRLVEEARTAIAIDQAAAAYADGEYDKAGDILDQRNADVSAMARELGDRGLADSIERATGAAKRGFAQAPAASAPEGQRALKGSRASAYSLAR